jgi:cell wall-associated NlpC family hydrolase
MRFSLQSRSSSERRSSREGTRVCLLAAALFLLGAPLVQAAVSMFVSRAAWLGESINVTTISFSGIAPTGGYSDFTVRGQLSDPRALQISGVKFIDITSFNSPNALWVIDPLNNPSLYDWGSGAVLQGPGTTHFANGSNLGVYFPSGVTSVGLDLMTVAPFGGNVQIYLSGPGDVVHIQTNNYPTPTFVGFTSPVPIDHISLSAPGNPLIDNFAFGSAGHAPLVNAFTASPSTITAGQSSTLSWTTTNATTVSISGVTGTQPANGSVSVSPTTTTTYTLTATGSGGTASATATITVNPVTTPTVISFVGNPSTITVGQSSTLSWATMNSTTVSISGVAGTQPANGSVLVSPTATTTYALTATGSGGTSTATMATLTVTVTSLGPVAATLARQVVGGDYQSGAKGWDWNISSFVGAAAILSVGYHWNFANPLVTDNALDCSGLVFWSYNDSYGASRYQSATNPVYYEGADGQYRYNSVPVDESQLLPGDLMFFHFEGAAGFVSHVAMYVGCCGPNGADVVSASSSTTGIVWRNKDQYKALPGFVGFGRINAPAVGIRFTAHSPVDLIVTDPDGYRITPEVTITTSEEVLHEIPGVLYYAAADVDSHGTFGATVFAPVAKHGSYLVHVAPKPDALPTDTYSIDVEMAGKTIQLAASTPVRDIPQAGYGVTVTNGTIVLFTPASRRRVARH